MSIRIHFERSDACAAIHGLPAGRITTVEADDTEGPWTQLTHDTLRSQDGAEIAWLDEGDWYCRETPSQPFSDIVIEFVR